MEELVVEPAVGSGNILELDPGSFHSIDQLRDSIPGFFEYYRAPEPLYPVQEYRIRFISTDYDGSPVSILAQVFVPVAEEATDFPRFVFASGTTGLSDASAPSLEIPEVERWGWYTQNMLAYASQGFIVVLPDYTGFNDDQRTQRYFSKFAEGYMMLDAFKVSADMFDRPELEGTNASIDQYLFTGGYSQGGHAAMAAADLRPYYAPELAITGIITFGSTNDIEALMREGVAYAPLIMYSYREIYGDDSIDISRFLQPRFVTNFETQALGRLPQFQSTYGFSQENLFTEEFRNALNNGTVQQDFPDLYQLMEENDSGLSGHGVPTLIIQGGKDFIVTTATQLAFAQELRQLGSQVRMLVYPKASHRYTRHAGFPATIWWMRELSGRN